ncbi:MAG: cation:proton antiporter [Gammaproteobacteria bacterium]
MITDPLAQILLLLAAAVGVVALARRAGLPAILGYLIVGIVLGPHALGLFDETEGTRLLAELGVVFLLFTLGLEFSWPRMVAMRREVFGVGSVQVVSVAGVATLVFHVLGVDLLAAVALGGAVAVSSTAIIVQQLTEQSEINRTHGRVAFSVLLVQDLAFVPFLVLAGALAAGSLDFSAARVGTAVALGTLAVGFVLLVGRYALRPLFHEIAHSRLQELFTLAVLLVALGSAWVSHAAGVSMASGAFLAGVMLAETEYRHQVEAAIRPFRDILLGLFFISVGMMLDLGVLQGDLLLILGILAAMTVAKALLMTLVGRLWGLPPFKAVRTGIVLSVGGEFGIAILTILMHGKVVADEVTQPLLVAIVLSMVTAPLLLRQNRRIARWLLREQGPPDAAAQVMADAAVGDRAVADLAAREHVILCGFGRVGQNLARVLESQGHECFAVDLDPARVRSGRAAGLPVIFGDASDPELLRKAGLAQASAVVVTFADPAVALGIVRSVRAERADVPLLVRTADDARLEELMTAGATEVVPETFEASLMLASHALLLLRQPVSRVVRAIGSARSDRYASLRGLLRATEGVPAADPGSAEELVSVVLPPGAWAIGRSLGELRAGGIEARVDSVRRRGIVGRDPQPDMTLQQGDEVVLIGTPAALEHAEQVMLAG